MEILDNYLNKKLKIIKKASANRMPNYSIDYCIYCGMPNITRSHTDIPKKTLKQISLNLGGTILGTGANIGGSYLTQNNSNQYHYQNASPFKIECDGCNKEYILMLLNDQSCKDYIKNYIFPHSTFIDSGKAITAKMCEYGIRSYKNIYNELMGMTKLNRVGTKKINHPDIFNIIFGNQNKYYCSLARNNNVFEFIDIDIL